MKKPKYTENPQDQFAEYQTSPGRFKVPLPEQPREATESPPPLCGYCHTEVKPGKKFCSLECYGNSNTIKPVSLICEHCKTPFSRKSYSIKGEHTFCSVECFNQYKHNNLVGNANLKVCPTCKKEFQGRNAQVEVTKQDGTKTKRSITRQSIYCSKRCEPKLGKKMFDRFYNWGNS